MDRDPFPPIFKMHAGCKRLAKTGIRKSENERLTENVSKFRAGPEFFSHKTKSYLRTNYPGAAKAIV